MGYLAYGFVIILLVLGIAAFRRISLYSPLVLSALVWLFVFGIGFIYQDVFNPITEQAFLMWLTWFLITSFIYFIFLHAAPLSKKSELRRLPFNYSFFIVLLIIWLGYRIWVIGNAGPSHFFLNLRLSSNELEGYESLGLIGRFYPLVFALFLFENVNACRDNQRERWLLWGWMLLYAVATMGKFAVLTPIFAWLIIKGVRGQLSIRIILSVGVFALILMLALHFIRSGESDDASISEVISIYIYSPIVALGYMEINPNPVLGAYVFRFIYAVAHTLFVSAPPEPVILSYVEVPFFTNVYTVLQPFVHDFGVAGVVFGALFYGLVFGALFWWVQTKKTLPIILYAGLSIVLVGQFFSELLLTMLSGNLQFMIAAITVVLVSKRRYLAS